MSSKCFWCFGRGSALVIMSAVCSGSLQLSILTNPFSTRSRTQQTSRSASDKATYSA
ncbi:hypothetical protein BDZ94DRAFT_1276572 [Collybia nuda]|uniref:Uncharacterized protein n=1 Tax=Collybia nuda TaxID=64659 RepID=A0A9P5XR81_9AGAR|nr:hypothetical protein BDZ94DRAFT_1276572 [Collybia nuda]